MRPLSRCAEARGSLLRIGEVSTSRCGHGDRGSASLEFISAGLLMLIPMVYLMLTLGTIQSAALATEGAARQGARVFVQAPSHAAGAAAAQRALDLALADHRLESTAAAMRIRCTPRPEQCHTRRGWVTIEVAVRVPLPLVPSVFDLRVPLALTVEASATQQVSRFWGAR